MNPACVSTWYLNGTKHFQAFMATAKKNGIEPQNADASKWEGRDWTEIPWHKKTDGYLKFARENQDKYSHMMFVDSYDILFAAGWDEIMEKYLKFEAPIVIGAECYCWPNLELASQYPATPHRCKYLNAGFWMAETKMALWFLEECVSRRKLGQDDQSLMVDIFLDFYNSVRPMMKLDTACSVLFCCNMDSLDFLELRDGRPTCTDTGEKPCLFHGNGASPLQVVSGMLT